MRVQVAVLILLCISGCSKKELDLSGYQFVDENLELQVIASEPMIVAPVAIDFDVNGRIWVAEMPDYMPDINGEKESIPAGRIVILEDKNFDGVMDESKVFLDKIHHLRTLKLYNGGILYGDDNNLYFSEIQNDTPVNTTIIDSVYAEGGNIEHKPNGLLMNIDNCIYSAKSHFRYCLKDGIWSKEPTNFRGQWGITRDQNGRLYSNDNSNLLYGDQFLPNTVIKNQFLHDPNGLNIDIVKSRRIFPVQATAINRGYTEGALDSNGLVINTTSACSPLIFNSSALGSEFNGDAFVCIPEANLIKRLKVHQNKFLPSAKFAYNNAEFLTSLDQAFRPVNLSIGPDGYLYIVDFHRGVIQHKIYMTRYLKEQIKDRRLDEVVNYGRILKIKPRNAKHRMGSLTFNSPDSLISYLSSENSWIRFKAHEILALQKSPEIDKRLYDLLANGRKLEQLHAIWILAAHDNIDLEKIKEITFQDPWVVANLFKIIGNEKLDFNTEMLTDIFKKYAGRTDSIVQNHLLTALSVIYKSAPELHSQIVNSIEDRLESAKISAFPSGSFVPGKSEEIEYYRTNVDNQQKYFIYNTPKKGDSEGYDLFNQYCASCHGFGGQGLEGLAPPLEGAQLVNSSPEIVPLIIMHGLEGEITVRENKRSFSSVMPSFDLDIVEIEKISNYIYNAFRNEVNFIKDKEIQKLRNKYSGRKHMWSEEELLSTDF